MNPSRRSLLAGFLALPVAARFKPVSVSREGWEVVDTGEWFASSMEMFAAYGFVFEHHRVRVHGHMTAIALGDCPAHTSIRYNVFELAGPPPSPLRVPCFGLDA